MKVKCLRCKGKFRITPHTNKKYREIAEKYDIYYCVSCRKKLFLKFLINKVKEIKQKE